MSISEQDDPSDTKLHNSTTTSSKEKSESCEKHLSTRPDELMMLNMSC